MVFGTSSVAVDLTIFRFVTYWFVRRPDVAKILLQEGIRGLKGLSRFGYMASTVTGQLTFAQSENARQAE